MTWRTIERPGFFGKKRDKIIQGYNDKYGEGLWRIRWQWGNQIIPKEMMYQIYEDGYYADSFQREVLWKELITAAKEVYDHQESDIESGLDYLVQNSPSTHLQDISIRRVVLRRGWEFSGDRLIQIRSHNEYWGDNLSPGKVPFHLPEMIVVPHLAGWWDDNSIEAMYQDNKVLQVKELFQKT